MPVSCLANLVSLLLRGLVQTTRHDAYSIFQEPVSERDAPGYFDVVKRPMDFGSMRKKVIKGNYGKGSKAAAR